MAERALAVGYAPIASRAGLAALLALDDRLGGIVRSTREPMVGQMRLTWWHDALGRLDATPAPAEPVLQLLANHVVGEGIGGGALAAMIDGWEALLDGPTLDDATLITHAQARGGRLFTLAGRLAHADDGLLSLAGEGWALADLAANLSDPATAARARALSRARFADIGRRRWPRSLRGVGALALLARMNVADDARPAGHPLRLARLLRHRLTGY